MKLKPHALPFVALCSLTWMAAACSEAPETVNDTLPGVEDAVPDAPTGEEVAATPAIPAGGESGSAQDEPPADAPATGTPAPGGTPPSSESPALEQAVYVKEWVVSPTGNDAAAGTASAPLRTINRAITLARPGHLIRVLAGTYAERLNLNGSIQAGTATAPITLRGEGKPSIVPPASGSGAQVILERPYWKISGFNIDLKGKAAYAVIFAGNVQGTVLSQSEIHHAAYNAGVSFHRAANGGTLENNHIHHIWIAEGKDAHGVMVQPTAKNITIRNNIIHDNSGDAIQCHSPDGSVPAEPATNVLIEGNDLYGNYEQSLDIKTCYDVTVRYNRMHDNWTRGNGAMVVHMSAKNILIEENEFYNAGVGVGVGGNHYGPVPSGVVIRRNRFRDMRTTGGWSGGGLALENSEGTQVLNNTFTRLPGPAIKAGGGTGGPTSNLVVKNNIVDVAQAVSVGSQAPGLKMDTNLYKSGASFVRTGTRMDFTRWKSLGFDSHSWQGDAQLNTTTLMPGPIAIDRGEPLNLCYCGAAPDLGAVETGC